MAGRIGRIIDLVGNMGWRYVSFRARYELLRRSGLFKKKFPAAPPFRQYLTLEDWKKQDGHFFFKSREDLHFARSPTAALKETYDKIRQGKYLLFNSVLTSLGTDYDWITNPDTGFRYDIRKHWTEIPDLSKEAGDIKYVWEKSRFSYLYDVIRYDYHFGEDCSAFVFGEILSWIKANPVNCGPNYRCSQEMSLRVLNWTFALHYYRNSPNLNAEVFDQVQYALYWHMHHVFANIDFSRIAVRNNHAITETLTLYLAGLLYPALPGAAEWKQKGKTWFEEEIAYQVYPDGTYLQFSMNYHRIVVQLLTWGMTLAEKNGEQFADVVYERAEASLKFLRACMVDENGWLPNYGANDGALFFKLSSTHYRDYRPQLEALAVALGFTLGFGDLCEDTAWYGIQNANSAVSHPAEGVSEFQDGGYYIIREPDTLTFFKCGVYKDRPSQADNLHVDIWYKGENLLLDAGSYKYNTDNDTLRYFTGTASHNTVMVSGADQMLKGGRFIWYFWPKQNLYGYDETETGFKVFGSVNVFRHLKEGIMHTRTVTKQKAAPVWQIEDEFYGLPPGASLRQIWHMPSVASTSIDISATGSKSGLLAATTQDGWYSSFYGVREKTKELYFSTGDEAISTAIKLD